MRVLRAAAVAACLIGVGGALPASASVMYEFSATGLNYQVYDFSGPDPVLISETPYDASFTVITASPITTAGSYATSSCSISIAELVCGATQDFDPDGFGLGADFISFQFVNADMSGGGGAFFFFEDGAFLANGAYGVIDPGGGFGNAGAGTLTVSGITEVPEPMTLALFGAGVFGLGLLRRRS